MTGDGKDKSILSAGTRRRPSVAVVIPQYGRIGGAENMAFQLCERLAGRFDLHVFARKWEAGDAPVTFHKVSMIHFPRWLQPVSFAAFARKRIAERAFDLIHSHERIWEMDLLTFHGIPHETWIRDMRQKSLSGFDRATCWSEKKGIENPALQMILPVSNLVKNELTRRYPVPENRIRVIHPGVSLERFSRLDARSCRTRIRDRFGFCESDVILCFIGMNFEIKRLELIIRGMGEMKQGGFSDPLPKLLVVGKGNSGPYLHMAKALGIMDRMVFAGITDEVEAYYLAGDIFAMPSRMDTFGLAVLEAMAAGLPVVISPTVGAADLVADGISGWILPENPSPRDMATALIRLMDPEVRRSMGAAARNIAKNHDWDRVADTLAGIYDALISARIAAGPNPLQAKETP